LTTVIGTIDTRISEAAGFQHGVVSRTQLLDLGMTPRQVQRRIRNGRLRPLHRGVYLVGPRISSRAREMGAVLACGEGAVLSHRSAAVLWGLLPPLAQPSEDRPSGGAGEDCHYAAHLYPVHVSQRNGDRGRGLPGIRVHRVTLASAGDTEVVDRIPVTAPLRTLLDLAWAEASKHPDDRVTQREVEQAVARAEREGLVDLEELAAVSARGEGRGHQGAPLLRTLVDRENGPALTRSEAEERFLGLVRQAKLPPPHVNVRVGAYELDFLWPGLGLGVEVDGFDYHASMNILIVESGAKARTLQKLPGRGLERPGHGRSRGDAAHDRKLHGKDASKAFWANRPVSCRRRRGCGRTGARTR
jgi:hypothetical protein